MAIQLFFSELGDCSGKCPCLKNAQCDLYFDMTSCKNLNAKE